MIRKAFTPAWIEARLMAADILLTWATAAGGRYWSLETKLAFRAFASALLRDAKDSGSSRAGRS